MAAAYFAAMDEFVAGLTQEARKELLDYLHDCRHRCRSSRRSELYASLSKLVAALERAALRERKGFRLLKLVKPTSELSATQKRPTQIKKVPPGD